MTPFFKKPSGIITTLIIVGVVALIVVRITGDALPNYESAIAERRDLVQEVSVTGRVEPTDKADLAFEKSGRVNTIYVSIGDIVTPGERLITLDSQELSAQLAQTKAQVSVQNAKLEELLSGTREEEIALQEAKVSNAKQSLIDAEQNLIDKINDAYTKSDDAVRGKIDQFFDSPESSNPKLSFTSTSNPQLEIDVEFNRLLLQSILANWNTSLNSLTFTSDFSIFVGQAKSNLDMVKSFLDDVAVLINGLVSSASLSQTTIDSWKADVSTARTNVNTAIVNLTAADEKLQDAEATLLVEEKELDLLQAGTIDEQILAQEAAVAEAEANADVIQAQIDKTILRAPFGGIVTRQEATIGEIVAANEIIVSIISESTFEIEAHVPEADIAKIALGDIATLTLDAYGRDIVFEAQVIAIDPAETIIDGVATYTTTLQFAEEDERIKSGMTANIDILADERTNVIAVPQRAVIKRTGETIIRIPGIEGAIDEISVIVGLKSSDGYIEITSGIAEGDTVITFSEDE